MTNQKAYNYAIRLLARRDYSTFKMRKKLIEQKFSPEEIDETIERLIDMNYLREAEYKRMRIKQLLVKGYANSYIIPKLVQEELYCSDEEIDELREEQSFSESEQIQKHIHKKLRYKEIPDDFESKMKLQNKVLNFLRSKGFSLEEARREYNNYLKEY